MRATTPTSETYPGELHALRALLEILPTIADYGTTGDLADALSEHHRHAAQATRTPTQAHPAPSGEPTARCGSLRYASH